MNRFDRHRGARPLARSRANVYTIERDIALPLTYALIMQLGSDHPRIAQIPQDIVLELNPALEGLLKFGGPGLYDRFGGILRHSSLFARSFQFERVLRDGVVYQTIDIAPCIFEDLFEPRSPGRHTAYVTWAKSDEGVSLSIRRSGQAEKGDRIFLDGEGLSILNRVYQILDRVQPVKDRSVGFIKSEFRLRGF